jgi:hypothetical protein
MLKPLEIDIADVVPKALSKFGVPKNARLYIVALSHGMFLMDGSGNAGSTTAADFWLELHCFGLRRFSTVPHRGIVPH